MYIDSELQAKKNLTLLLYVLYGFAIFSAGILAIIALIVNYVKRDAMHGTIYASHFTWQIRTVWWYLFWNILGLLPFGYLFFSFFNQVLHSISNINPCSYLFRIYFPNPYVVIVYMDD